jgi:hypothetical protein
MCFSMLLTNAPCAWADNWVNIEGVNRAHQKISVSFEAGGDGHADILVQTEKHASGSAVDFKDQPCGRLFDAPLRTLLKQCEKDANSSCNIPPNVNTDPVKMVCSAKGASPLAGVTYKIVRVADLKTCIAFRFECADGCSSRYVPAVMIQGIDECLD